MKLPRKGVAAAVVVGMVQLVFAGPAAAGSATCHELPVAGATLCVDADAGASGPPTIEREQCGGFGSCMTYYLTYEAAAYAEAGVTFCYTAGGGETCTSTGPFEVPLDLVAPDTTCIGYDLRGGFPCPNGGPIDP